MPINKIQPLQGLNKMSLSGLSDREKEQWYKANEQQLAKYSYSPRAYEQAAEQMYQNQLFRQKFGEAEFNKTFGMPGGAAYRRQQLETRLTREAIRNTFKPKTQYVTDINTLRPYVENNGQLMKFTRDDKDVNISDEEYQMIEAMDTQGQQEVLRAYYEGKWRPQSQLQKNNIFSKYDEYTPDVLPFAKALLGDKSEENTKALAENSKKFAERGPFVSGLEVIGGTIAGIIGEGRDYYNKNSNKITLDKIYDESTHRIAESPEVSKLKSDAYLDNNIVGSNDEETKRIFYSIITPTTNETGDYDNVNLGIPTYAAYFGNGKNVRNEVKDIGIDEMREIIATKYAMEKAGVPKAQVRDMLEREAQKHVAGNEGWLTGKKKFFNDMLIAATAYTADKWNGIYNAGLMVMDNQDGGQDVWVDEKGNIIDPSMVTVVNDVWDDKAKRYIRTPGTVIYTDKDGKDHVVHNEKISRSALLMMGLDPTGKNAGAKSTSWTDPSFWTKAEQYGVWSQDEVDKWDKIGASPYAKAWDPDEKSHLMYESMKMMSFGLADQALMFIPGGAGIAAKAISGTSKVAALGKGTLDLISKLGSASKFGQVANNIAASMGIGFAYARNSSYEEFSKNMANLEATLRAKSEADIATKYETDKEYKASVDQRIAKLTDAYIRNFYAENARDLENGNAVIDEQALRQQAQYQAYQQVQDEELKKQMDANRTDPEFRKLHEDVINTAAYTSNLMAITDAMKYFAVGAFGYRRYLYENPTTLFKQSGNTLKEALRGTKDALKHIKDAKNAEGKMRLSTVVAKDFAGLRNQAKQLGKATWSQFKGGAWTNGTDDMQVDAVQQINEDATQQMYDSYLSGEPMATTFWTLDNAASFMSGLGQSLGQDTTWNAALVGGLGGTISGNLNFANIVSLATKEGRKAFKEQYNTRYQRDAEGAIQYKDEAVLDENGNELKDENGKTITRKVPIKENLKWNQNIGAKLGFFLQNGVLNTYYGKKQEAFNKVDRVQAANQLLDQWGDFTDLEDYLSSDVANENVTTEREKRTSSFIKAFRLARALDNVGKTQDGKKDIEDPLLASSLYQKAKTFIDKANSMEVYDTGINIGDFTAQEVEEMLKEWYSKHPQESRSQSKDVEVLQSIAKNAKELTQAMNAYNEASIHIAKSEQQSNKTFSSHVKNKMVEDYVLYNHWQNRLDKMKRETGDTSSSDRQLSPEEFIASIGGLTNAESLSEVYNLMIDGAKANEKVQADKNVEASKKKLDAARRKYDNAKTIDEKQSAEKEVSKAYSEYDNNLATQEYVNELISRLEQKRDQVDNSLEQTKDVYVAELQDQVGHLTDNKQRAAITRARKLSLTQKKIQEHRNSYKSNKKATPPSETREFNRLRKQEQVDRKWLKNNLGMNDAQLQQFVARVNEVYTINNQSRVLTADEIMSLDPVTRSKMLDPENRRLYSDEQLKEIDNLIAQINMKDPTALEKLHDIARLGQQMERVMDSYKRLSQHPEGAALAIEADRKIAAEAAHSLIDRRFAKDVANFIEEFDDKIIVNSTDESNDIVGAVIKYRDRLTNIMGLRRFLEAKAKVDDEARFQGKKPKVTQRDKEYAIFQLLRTLNSRILSILDEEHLIDKYRTELDKARRWVATVEDISSITDQMIWDDLNQKRAFQEHVFNLTFFCDDKEDIMRQLEIEANKPTKPEFTANILNLLDDLEELGHLRNSVVVKRNAEKYKDVFKQKAEALINKNRETVNKAFSNDSQDDLDDFINNLSEDTRKALESILSNSKNRNLNESGSRYVIDGKEYARVTSVKSLLKGAKISKIDQNSPWVLPSTSIGNSLDEFGRDVFNGIYDNMTEEERLQEFEKRYDNSTAENYEEVYKKLKDFQSKLKDKNQRIIKLGNSADNQGSAVAAGTIAVIMPDGTEMQIRIAGSLDILAMDNQGNLHIYDFKTYHSKDKLNIASATSKGYDRQLSMYAKLLEEEYGLKVASINILPVHADYPAPKGTGMFNKTGAEYKRTGANSNQLSVKEKGSSSFKEFKEANFKVEDAFGIVRISDDNLTIDYAKLNSEDKAEVDKLLAEQGQQTTQSTDSTPTATEQTRPTVETQTDTEQKKEEKEESKESPATLSITEINTSYTNNGRTENGHYTVEVDEEGFVHINFDRGNANAKRGASLNEIGVTKEQAFGTRENWAAWESPKTWDDIPVNDKLTISSIIIDPDGNVVVETLYGVVEGNVARKMLDKAFPELTDYMSQFSKPEELVQTGQGEDVDLGIETQTTSQIEQVGEGEGVNLEETTEAPNVEPVEQTGEGEEVNFEEENNQIPETDTVHDNGTDVWVESSEGNTQEAESADEFNEYQGESDTLEDSNEDSSGKTDTNTQTDTQVNDNDTRILPLSGNANPVYQNTKNSPLAKEGQLVKRTGEREGDTTNTLRSLLDTFGIKLQDIIDEELAPIFMEKPDTPIKFMAVNWVSKEHSPTDKQLSTTCFLVIDYDARVRNIHSDGKNGKKNNGGVITAQGKEYLVIGTMGWGMTDLPGGKRKQALWNSIFGRSPMGFAKKSAANFFMNPENNGERFYVIKNDNGEFYSTIFKEGSITPGWFVKLPNGQKQPLSKLLRGGNETNPYGLTWDTLNFGLAEYTQFYTTMDSRAVMNPGNLDVNAGRAFVLIPAGNGKYAPAYIQTTKYKELTENSPLDQRINKLLDDLLARNYNDRLKALKTLYKYFYLSNGEGVNETNFLLRKNANIISVVKAGKVIKEFQLDHEDFDRQEFKEYVKQEMNPRINITPATLSDVELLKEYDASGALLVDLAMLRTAGSNFEIWPVGMDNQVLKPEEPISQHSVEAERTRGVQVPYMGQYYIRDTNGVYKNQNGEEVTDVAVIEELEINRRINESGLRAEKITNNKATYILDQSINNPLVVEVDTNTYKVRKLNNEDAASVIQEAIAKREQEARDKAAKEALDEEVQKLIDDTTPSQPEVVDQARAKELKDIEDANYEATLDVIKNHSNSDIEMLLAESEQMYNRDNMLDEESKALLRGEIRAYYSELERREQQEQPQTPQQPEVRSINQDPQNNPAGTITFQQLIANKNNLGRLMEVLKQMPDAPRQMGKLVDYLKSRNINTDAIGNTQEDIDAWFETLINCR